MKSSIIILAVALSTTNAMPPYRFPIERRAISTGRSFSARAGVVLTVGSNSTSGISNIDDILYTTTITLCGQGMQVIIDTGSADLRVKPPTSLKGVETTKLTTNVAYGNSNSAGPISICPIFIGSYYLKGQAFVSLTPADNSDELFSQQIYGFMGLGFDSFSNINSAVHASDPTATWGRSLLSNLFSANPKTGNFVAFLLDRASDLHKVSRGSFTIGETEAQYSSVISQPTLPVYPDAEVRRWNVVLDDIVVNGAAVQLKSSVGGVASNKAIALFDTSSSFTYGPKAAVDAIYSVIPGSVYDEHHKFWLVPCTKTTSVAFTFAGIGYPVHPLDLTTVTQWTVTHDKTGTACLATIRETSITDGSSGFDWIMGDNFLRNVYSMFDFGDLDTSTGGIVGHPFVKLLSLPSSDPKTSTTEFQTTRSAALAALPPVLDPATLVRVPADSTSSSSKNPATGNLAVDTSGANALDATTLVTMQDDISKAVKYLPIILGLLGANVLIVLALLIAGCAFFFRRKGQSAYNPVKTYGH